MAIVGTDPSITDRLTALAVSDLLDRYLIGLDDRPDEAWAASLFTTDAVVEFPVGRHDGLEGLAGFHRAAMAKFARTQHVGAPSVVDVDGDRATLRAHLVSHQVLPSEALFTTGTAVRGQALRTAEGWRLRRLSFRLIWSSGEHPTSAGA